MREIWWSQVTNAVRYVTEIKQSLLEEKSILLKYTNGMPWRDQLEETIVEAVTLQNSEKKFVKIPIISNPGEYLLNEFCKKEKRAEYRPTKGYAKFFAESDEIVLHDRYFWVQIGAASCLNNWMKFVSDYIKERGKKDNIAVFILEWAGNELVSVKKGIRIFFFDDYVGEYDRIVFAVLASSSIKENSFVKNYIAELVANVSGNDIELCAECIGHYKEFLENSWKLIQTIIAEKVRSDETDFCYTKTAEEVKHLIWLAQIKTVYPYLEEYRENFVQKHANEISKRLTIQTSYGETYTDPKDVELGTLMYMAGCNNLVLSTSEYEKLKKYKEARNKLSHLIALTIKEIRELL